MNDTSKTNTRDNSEDLLFAELNEEMRQDQVIKFVKTHRWWIIGSMVGFVVLFGAFLAFQQFQQSQRLARATTIQQASVLIEQGEVALGTQQLADMAERGDFYGYQAAMLLGKHQLAEGQAAQARETFQKAAKKTSMNKAYTQLAEIMALSAGLDAGLTDAERTRIDTLAGQKGPYQNTAQHLQLAARVSQGDSREFLASLADDEAASPQLKALASRLEAALKAPE